MPFVVGVVELHILIPGARSLKEKRKVVKAILEKLKHRFNVSVSEVDMQDVWQRAVLAVAMVGTSRQVVDSTLEKVVAYVESVYPGYLASYRKEIV
jgi:uncharacterized protein YlxP (DUF503 family)